MNKTILVTGAAGFVGKHLIRSLIERGYGVKALVRPNTDIVEINRYHPGGGNGLSMQIVTGDLRNKESLYQPLKNVDAVIHLASTMKGPWEEYLESTVNGTRRLLEISREKGIKRFIYISSISVYETFAAQGLEITENSSVLSKDFSLYERSKIEAEKVVGEFIGQGVDAVILRPAVIYGPGGPLLVPRLGLSFGANRFLVIGNGQNKIPLIYVKNLVGGIIAALEAPQSRGQTYNFVDDQTLTQDEYLSAVKESLQPSLSIMHWPYPVALGFSRLVGTGLKILKKQSPFRKVYLNICRQRFIYSNQKAKKELNWQPSIEAKAALAETINYFKEKIKVPKDANLRLARTPIALSKPVTVGIVGCGIIAKTHLDILKKIFNLNVVGLCDSDIEAAARMGRDYGGIKAYKNMEEMFKAQKVDVVHILTPPQSHKDLTIQAADHKCHVFVEKPMAVNADEAKQMLEAARRNDIKLCVGHNHVYDPPMIQARRLIAQGALGQILYAESWYGFNLGENLSSRYMVPGADRHWAMTIPGKLYQNLISHPISVLTDAIGWPQEIHAAATSANLVKAMNTDELKVMFKSKGKIGMLTVSLAVNPRYQFLNIYGTNMCIFVDFLNKTLIKHATPKMIPKPVARAMFNLGTAKVLIGSTLGSFVKVITRKFTYFDGTEILIKKFYQSITDGTDIPIPAEEGVRSMEVMDEIWRQIQSP